RAAHEALIGADGAERVAARERPALADLEFDEVGHTRVLREKGAYAAPLREAASTKVELPGRQVLYKESAQRFGTRSGSRNSASDGATPVSERTRSWARRALRWSTRSGTGPPSSRPTMGRRCSTSTGTSSMTARVAPSRCWASAACG